MGQSFVHRLLFHVIFCLDLAAHRKADRYLYPGESAGLETPLAESDQRRAVQFDVAGTRIHLTRNDFACRRVYLDGDDTAAGDMGPAALIRIDGSLSPDDRVVIQF